MASLFFVYLSRLYVQCGAQKGIETMTLKSKPELKDQESDI